MRFSELPFKPQRKPPTDEESVNARLLTQAGFIRKLSAGVYTFLPLGLRVLNKIEQVVRTAMIEAGGIELLMPALHPKENWAKTGRWQSFDALFKLKGRDKREYALGPTHEEVLYPLLVHYVSSYKDLPLSLFQIQTKFRDEPRAKSGLLRSREFRMKDLYSFHASEKDRDRYYETMRKCYRSIFNALGVETIETAASGGTFSERSIEFQVRANTGEDILFFCSRCNRAVNQEIVETSSPRCPNCKGMLKKERGIEVGNIFPLKDTYAKDFKLTFRDQSGKEKLVAVGCYGLGTSRLLGTMVEVSHDEKGIIWNEKTSPFRLHLLTLAKRKTDSIFRESESLFLELTKNNIETLYDDRLDASAGVKFNDADFIGIPRRLVVSSETLSKKKIEIRERKTKKVRLISKRELFSLLQIRK